MNNCEVNELLNIELEKCKKDHRKENLSKIVKLVGAIGACESFTVLLAQLMKDVKPISYSLYIIGFIFGYAFMTTDDTFNYNYSKEEYVEFLKTLKEELKLCNKFEKIEVEEFNNVLENLYSEEITLKRREEIKKLLKKVK